MSFLEIKVRIVSSVLVYDSIKEFLMIPLMSFYFYITLNYSILVVYKDKFILFLE